MTKRLINKDLLNIIAIILVSATGLSFALFSATSSHAESLTAGVTVGSACTMTATINTTHTAEVPAGSSREDIGSTELKTTCNDSGGFAVYAVGFSNDEYGNNKMLGANSEFNTGTATSGANSNWSMKLSQVTTGTYATTIDGGFDAYSDVPATFTKVAHRNAGTGSTAGSSIALTYSAYIAATQTPGDYTGKVKFTLVHPSTEIPAQPQPATAGCINYFANASNAEGTMGCQPATDDNTVTLFASNFSRDGYGFAGWSDAYDYATNPNANFYGPNEDITVPTDTTTNGLSLYAVWVKSEGSLQDASKVATLCGTGTGSLTPATYSDEGDSDEATWSISANLSSITALTDTRDDQTYAIARLTDGKCWMIENLRLADTHQEGVSTVPTTLTTTNTNNPLNNGDATNPTVTLKHNYSDAETFTNLSPTSSVTYDETTSPEGWCKTHSAACDNQSRLRTDNTASRVAYTPSQIMSSDANLYSYGNYYNWYSATAGNGTYGKTSGNTAGDLCPAGWHLPTGTGSGEFGLFSNSLGGYKNASDMAQQMNTSTTPTATIIDKRIRHFPNNFVYSGSVGGALLDDRGTNGFYWASTAGSSSGAYFLFLHSSYVYPGTDFNYKYNGRSVRCVASS